MTMSAWVKLTSGPSPQLKVFAQTGSQYAWSDNGTIFLSAGVWTCVSLPFSSPSYQQATYDPTQVIRIGFEMLATSSFQLYVDTVSIY
jgi:hypothetical protein